MNEKTKEVTELNEVCDLCGLPTKPFERKTHAHCWADENIRADMQYLDTQDDSMIYSPLTFIKESGSNDSIAP